MTRPWDKAEFEGSRFGIFQSLLRDETWTVVVPGPARGIRWRLNFPISDRWAFEIGYVLCSINLPYREAFHIACTLDACRLWRRERLGRHAMEVCYALRHESGRTTSLRVRTCGKLQLQILGALRAVR